MDWTVVLLWLLAGALVLVGLAGTVLPALPGVAAVFAGLWLAAWIDGYARVGGYTLALLGLLTLLALAVDFVAAALGAQRVGASRQALAGAVIGAAVGVLFGLPGVLLGPFVGAVLGELKARSGWQQVASVGLASWLGFLFGTLAKLALALAMLGVFALAFVF